MEKAFNDTPDLSHPVWVRGLKQRIIDTPRYRELLSHPVWVRGLKHKNLRDIGVLNKVAPRVGAWIETSMMRAKKEYKIVAPRVGAWIETGGEDDRE